YRRAAGAELAECTVSRPDCASPGAIRGSGVPRAGMVEEISFQPGPHCGCRRGAVAGHLSYADSSWQTGPDDGRRPMKNTPDALVIGGGIAGLAAARQLTGAGLR